MFFDIYEVFLAGVLSGVLTSEFHLTKAALAPVLGSTFIGMFLGALVLGRAATGSDGVARSCSTSGCTRVSPWSGRSAERGVPDGQPLPWPASGSAPNSPLADTICAAVICPPFARYVTDSPSRVREYTDQDVRA